MISVVNCICAEEKKQRLGIGIINFFVWLVIVSWIVASMGTILIIFGAIWLLWKLMAEVNVRMLQISGTTVSAEQFPQIHRAAAEIAAALGISQEKMPRIIVINSSIINAFAVKFAGKKVVVLFSAIVEGVLDKPAELKFVLGHEMAHTLLDYGPRGIFELYKSAQYRAAREMSCDNCGVLLSGDIEASKNTLKRLCVGNVLFSQVSEKHLIEEAKVIYSGFSGWWVKQQSTYPPAGKRITNIVDFFSSSNARN